MASDSAGILLYRRTPVTVEVLLVHPGGPFWQAREDGAWSIPKGEVLPGEEPRQCALRELGEELGRTPRHGGLIELGEVRQRSGKRVLAWAAEGEFDPRSLASNTFSLQWPPRSGTWREFPEVDRAAWCDPARARTLLLAAQREFVDRLLERLGSSGGAGASRR